MLKRPSQLPLRVTLLYGVIAGAWILFSSGILRYLFPDADSLTHFEQLKGLAFVVVTSAILYLFVRQQVRRLNDEMAQRKKQEDSLRFFRTLVDQSTDGIEVLDPVTYRFIDINEMTCRELGYTREEMLTLRAFDIDPQVTEGHCAAILKRLRSGETVVMESVHRRKDGTIFPVELKTRLVTAEHEYIIVATRNIADRKKMEETKLQDLQYFKNMDRVNQAIQGTADMEQMPGNVLETLLDIFKCDRAWLVYPCDPSATHWQIPMERCRPEYPGLFKDNTFVPMTGETADLQRRVLASTGPVVFGPGTAGPVPEGIASRLEVHSLIAMALRPKGDKPWMFGLHQCSYARIWSEADKRLLEEAGRRLTDALTGLLAHRSLQESREQFRALAENASNPILRYDRDCRRIYMNSAALKLSQKPVEQLLGTTPTKNPLLGLSVSETVESALRKVIETGIPTQTAVAGKGSSGESFEHHLNIAPEFTPDGKVVGATIISTDITPIRQAEETQRENERRFSNIMRHARCIVRSGTVVGKEGWREHATDPQSPFIWNIPVLNAEAAQEMFPLDVEPGETYESKWLQARHPLDHAEMNRNSGRAFLYKQPMYRNEFRCVDKHGVEHWMQEYVTVQDIGDDRWRIFSIATDISEMKNVEEALRDSETRYRSEHALLRTLIDLLPFGVYIKDRSGRFIVVNPTLTKMLGKPSGEILGKSVADFLPSDRAAAVQSMEEKVFNGFPLIDHVDKITSQDATEQIVLTTKVAFPDSAGQVAGLIGIERDITEQRRAAEQVAHEQARFKLIFDTIPIGIAFNTVHADGTVTRIINDAHLRICGISRADHDRPGIYYELSHPDDRQAQTALHDKVIARKIDHYSLEKRYCRRDGKTVWVNFSYQRQSYPDGRLEELTTVIDITERKQAEEQLRKLSRAVEQSPISILITGIDGRIEYVNPKFTEMTGYRAKEAIGANPRILKSGQTPISEYRTIWRTITSGREWRGELLNRKKDGSLFWQSVFISPIFDISGKITHFLAIEEDITDRRQLEQQLRHSQKMEAIGQLAGGVAHDFNNILTIIQGNASLLTAPDLKPVELTEHATQIVMATDKAANLTRQLLMFSRKQVMQQKLVDINEIVSQMTKMLQRILGEDVSLVSQYGPSLPHIQADTGMIEQIILNLAVNARDAMPGGGRLTITTSVTPGSAEPAEVCLSVSDTGCGIAAENLTRIFEPFFTTKEVGKGTGLGLATVYGIVQQHHGRIAVESEVNSGTTFKIHFPAANVREDAARNFMQKEELPRGTETILVVEDEMPVRMIVSKLLQRCGYNIVLAESGADAMKKWEEHGKNIQLLLTDIIMPDGISGYELSEKLKKESPSLKVVYTSGYTGDLQGKRSELVEGENFLQKPYTSQRLAETLRNALDGK